MEVVEEVSDLVSRHIQKVLERFVTEHLGCYVTAKEDWRLMDLAWTVPAILLLVGTSGKWQRRRHRRRRSQWQRCTLEDHLR